MRVGGVDPALACRQHGALVTALRGAGARILQLPFLHGAFDSVFMKDSAILFERDGIVHALPTTFQHGERRVETSVRRAQLARAGFVVAPAIPTTLEGGDVQVLAHRKLALLGHGVRSHRDSATALGRVLGCDVVPLELRDAALFHLDTALTVLGDDTLVYCPEAFTLAARRTLALMEFRRTIEVSVAEAMRFSLNVVEIGTTIVTGTDSPVMTAIWESLGRTVRVAPLDQFQLAGGSAACLVARVTPLASRAPGIARSWRTCVDGSVAA